MKDAEASTDHGLVVAVEPVRKADAGAQVVAIRLDQRSPDPDLIGGQRAPELDRPGRQQRRDLRVRHDMVAAVGRDEVGVDVVAVDERADDFIAQTEEQR